MEEHVPVLIVGAGPSGLMMAHEFSRHGIPVHIIDKNETSVKSSNAAAIQARTLEIFSHIGLIDAFLNQGNRCLRAHISTQSLKLLLELDLSQIDSLYPFILMLPQSTTEQILIDACEERDVFIHRKVTLKAIKQSPQRVTATLTLANGKDKDVRCDWLVACDGAHSTARKLLDMRFPGEDIEEPFVVADAALSSRFDSHQITAFLAKGSALAAFPFSDEHYRVAANLEKPIADKIALTEKLTNLIPQRSKNALSIEKINWASPFWIHSKMIQQMRVGRVFFVGDAAHIHSPLGGQGMNTGLQDAYNLAWKLAYVTKNLAPETLLDTYEEERRPVITNIVKLTDRMTRALLSTHAWVHWLRCIILRCVDYLPGVKLKLATRLTQLNIRYVDNITVERRLVSRHIACPGERAPNVILDDGSTLYEQFKSLRHTLLFFSGSNADTDESKKMLHRLNAAFPATLRVRIVKSHGENDVNSIIDETDAIREAYGVPAISNNSFCFIIRPDTYIGSYHVNPTFDELLDRLKSYLIGEGW